MNDPWLTETDWIQIREENPLAFLALSPFKSTPLQRDEGFVTNYLQLVSALKEKGVVEVLETILQ